MSNAPLAVYRSMNSNCAEQPSVIAICWFVTGPVMPCWSVTQAPRAPGIPLDRACKVVSRRTNRQEDCRGEFALAGPGQRAWWEPTPPAATSFSCSPETLSDVPLPLRRRDAPLLASTASGNMSAFPAVVGGRIARRSRVLASFAFISPSRTRKRTANRRQMRAVCRWIAPNRAAVAMGCGAGVMDCPRMGTSDVQVSASFGQVSASFG